MSPLIELNIKLNDVLEIPAIYDPGSNVSLINSKLVKLKSKDNNIEKTNLRTINGGYKTDGLIKIKIKIMNIEDHINVFIINNENFKYNFLLGLDCIKKFKLIQNEKLEIEQKSSECTEPIIKEYQINFNEHVEINTFNVLTNHLNHHEETIIMNLIDKYRNIFAKDKYDIGTVKDYEARIDLIIDKYCSKRPYRCTIEDRKEIEEQISELLKKNLIEESYSPFAAPVTLAYKRDENKKSRLCIDFRDLNKIILPQSQPFPLIEDLIIKTRNCRYFSKLDINSQLYRRHIDIFKIFRGTYRPCIKIIRSNNGRRISIETFKMHICIGLRTISRPHNKTQLHFSSKR